MKISSVKRRLKKKKKKEVFGACRSAIDQLFPENNELLDALILQHESRAEVQDSVR